MVTKAYKLFRRRRDGSLGPLFINAKLRVPVGQWLPAEEHPTKGFAYRPGWRATLRPEAPHLSEKGRVWCEVRFYSTGRIPEIRRQVFKGWMVVHPYELYI